MNKLAIGILAFALFLAACENPADNKPKATVNNTNAVTNTAPAPARQTKGEAVAFNNENSKVGFTGSKVTGKHEGGFNKFTGTIDLVNNKAEESQAIFP